MERLPDYQIVTNITEAMSMQDKGRQVLYTEIRLKITELMLDRLLIDYWI